ncbi:MAG: DUF1993 family protein [Burkholderiales bacterium]
MEVPAWEDNEKSINDLKARIAKTIAYCKGLTPEQIDGSEDRDMQVKVAGNPVTYKGQLTAQRAAEFLLPHHNGL